MKRLLVAGLALALLVSGLAHAQQPQQATIRGAVVTATGRPIASVWVIVQRGAREAGRAVTADDGRYYLTRLSPGVYTLLVKRGEVTLHQAQVTLPRDAVYNVRLP